MFKLIVNMRHLSRQQVLLNSSRLIFRASNYAVLLHSSCTPLPITLQYVGSFYHIPTITMTKNLYKDILKRIRQYGVVRPKDLPGVTPYQLSTLCKQGLIQRIGRGLYQIANLEVSEHHDLAIIGRQAPDATICLISALSFHGLTTQMPRATWIAIENKARPLVIEYPTTEIIRMTGESLHSGITQHNIDGVMVRIFEPAKTVADCFKFRTRVGLDVALEALRDYRRQHQGGVDRLWKFAKICRVQSVIRPYLEAIG